MPWCRAHSGSHAQMFVTVDDYCCVFVGRPLWREVGSVDCQSESAFLSNLSVHIRVFTFQMFNIQMCVHTLYLRPLSVRAQYSNLCTTNTSSRCHGSLRHLNGRTVKVEVNLRPTVSRPVCLGVRRPSGTYDQFFFLLEISFRQLRVCYFVAPSLTRGRVCNLLYNCFWALPEQSLLGRSPAELKIIFYCLVWDSPNLEGQVPVFISPRNKVAQLYPRALGSLFVASYDSQGSRGGILTRHHTGLVTAAKFKPLIFSSLDMKRTE
jgi:hypothetical protein